MGSIVRRIAKNSVVRRVTKFLDWAGRFFDAVQIVTLAAIGVTAVGFTFGTLQVWLSDLPWQIRATIVLGIVVSGLGFILLVSIRARQWWLSKGEFPVYVIAVAHDDGVDLRIHNNRNKDKFKVQLVRGGVSIAPSSLPLRLPWKHHSGEYRTIPRTMEEVVKLCDYNVDLNRNVPTAIVTPLVLTKMARPFLRKEILATFLPRSHRRISCSRLQ